jgi:membrane-associated phospholipid phosphatase
MRAGFLFLTFALVSAVGAATAQPAGAQELSSRLSQPLFAPADLVGTGHATALAFDQDVPGVTKTEEHPAPQHTGFSAFAHALGSDFAAFPRRPSTWVILGVGSGLALLAHPIDNDVNAHLVGSKAVGRIWKPGHILGSAGVQTGVALGLYFGGRYFVPAVEGQPRTNKWSHLGYDLIRAQILSQALVQGTKYAVRRDRPTGDCCAFPSGHAASAFAAASILERHLGYRAAWPTLVAATYVATSRLHDNVHFLSDVLFGSAIGMATGWTIVGRHGRNEYTLLPTPVRGGFALALTRVGGRQKG